MSVIAFCMIWISSIFSAKATSPRSMILCLFCIWMMFQWINLDIFLFCYILCTGSIVKCKTDLRWTDWKNWNIWKEKWSIWWGCIFRCKWMVAIYCFFLFSSFSMEVKSAYCSYLYQSLNKNVFLDKIYF